MDAALDICNKLTVNVFEIYIMVRFFDTIFNSEVIDKRIGKITFCVKLVLTLLVDYYMPYVWVNFIVSLSTVFLLTCCYRSTVYKRIIVTVGVNLILVLSESIVAIVIGNETLGLFSRAANEKSIALFLSRMFFWIIVVCAGQWNKKNKTIQLAPKIWIFQSIVILTTLGELLIICWQGSTSKILESMSLLGAEITIYLLIYLYDCLVNIFIERTQAELIRKEKEYYHREAELIQQNQETTRQFQHDWKNRVQVMHQLADQEQWEELRKYLSDVKEKATQIQIYSNTGNIVVDSVINSKLNMAKKKEIAVTASVILPKDMEIDEDDMVVILGNLLDNAIEANGYVQGEKHIELVLCYEDGCVLIHIQNTFDRTLITRKGTYLTRKKNTSMHGIGIKSIKDTVEKYHGITEMTTDGNLFTADIMMYL